MFFLGGGNCTETHIDCSVTNAENNCGGYEFSCEDFGDMPPSLDYFSREVYVVVTGNATELASLPVQVGDVFNVSTEHPSIPLPAVINITIYDGPLRETLLQSVTILTSCDDVDDRPFMDVIGGVQMVGFANLRQGEILAFGPGPSSEITVEYTVTIPDGFQLDFLQSFLTVADDPDPNGIQSFVAQDDSVETVFNYYVFTNQFSLSFRADHRLHVVVAGGVDGSQCVTSKEFQFSYEPEIGNQFGS